MNNLALSDYVDLDDNHAKNKSILKMIVAFVILMIVYQLVPLISLIIKNDFIQLIAYLILAGIIAGIAYHIGDTVKVTNKPVKLDKVTLTIFIVFVVLWQLLLLINKAAIFKLSVVQIINILKLAIFAGIIEEALFRGLLLNAFIEVFHNKKYVFLWAGILESLCFALFHFLNLSHQTWLSTLGQVIIVFGSGLIMTYMRFATNGIWLVTIYHIYSDISPKLAGSNFGNSHVAMEFILMIVIVAIVIPAIYSYNKRYNEGILK